MEGKWYINHYENQCLIYLFVYMGGNDYLCITKRINYDTERIEFY
jgi:hypothetical protein